MEPTVFIAASGNVARTVVAYRENRGHVMVTWRNAPSEDDVRTFNDYWAAVSAYLNTTGKVS